MPDESAAPVPVRKRAPRADSRRNVDRILAAAQTLIEREGPDVTLDEIAKEAGVAPATLYRHFPSRMHLFEGVYRGRVARLASMATELAQRDEPTAALLNWLRQFVDLGVEAQGVLAGLLAQGLRETDPVANTEWGQSLLVSAADLLLRPAQELGAIRDDLTAGQLVALLTGITLAVHTLGGSASASAARALDAHHALNVLLEGLTPRP
ncbi:TetR family transcriptional regulator [Streptomyces sp. NPDC008317]|uniref:TetR/AcrR family transcriptional regulator n=1 Tax=Streptomyces sp. NPDC008317 TaxID=3364827 RepID=UPI0036EDB73B